MSRYVLDAGALIALDRNDPTMWARYRGARRDGVPMVTHGGILAQAVRSGRQARLAQALGTIEVIAVDRDVGHASGYLLAESKTRDAINGALVVICRAGDTLFTSDPDDIAHLVAASGKDVLIVQV